MVKSYSGRIIMLENQTTELKREYNDKVKNTLLAFLNTDGGTLYLGISNDGVVYGIEGNIDLEARRVATSFRDSITPDPSGYFSVEPEEKDGKYIIKVTVERGTAIPYCISTHGLVPQGVYVRVGSNTVMATREHIRQMIKDNGAGQFIAELSLEQNLTFDYADKIFDEKDVKFGHEQKQSLGLIRPDGRYTNLALILSDQCPYTTKAAIFEGANKEKFKDRKEFAGSLFKQIEDVLAYLHVYNRLHGTIEGAYRIDRSDYPDIALREAYVNALIHRDYYIEGSVLVSMFDDRLEFMSLGGAMPGVTHELMMAGVSVTRNEKLAQIFYRLKIIEAFGTGIPRIFSAYEENRLKPVIPIIDGGFLISIPNRNVCAEQEATIFKGVANNRHTTDLLHRRLSKVTNGSHEERILAKFSTGNFNKEEAATVLGISESGTYKLLQRMVKQELLMAQKEGRKWVYSVKEKT
jgi:ATP-dependent DNA helicase RecG